MVSAAVVRSFEAGGTIAGVLAAPTCVAVVEDAAAVETAAVAGGATIAGVLAAPTCASVGAAAAGVVAVRGGFMLSLQLSL